MINKSHRLTRNEVDDIKLSHLKHRQNGLLSLYGKNQKDHPQVAVVISKKIDKRAVERNKQKRSLISLVSDEIKKIPNTPLSIMFYPSKQFLSLATQEKKHILIKTIESACLKI